MTFASLVLHLGLLRMWRLHYWLKPRVPPHTWRLRCVLAKVSKACVASLQQGRGRPLYLRRQHTLANLFFEGQRCVGPQLAQLPPLRFSPDCPDLTGNQVNQGTEAQGSVSGPALEELTLVRRTVSAALYSPTAHPPETGSPLSGKQNNMAPLARVIGLASLFSRWEPADLPENMLNTFSYYSWRWTVDSC